MQLGDERPFRLLIHDRGSKFSGGFDEIFRSEGIRVIQTPVQAPNANAYAERWVRAVRNDCLDHLLIVGRRHLERVLRVYVRHYNGQATELTAEGLPADALSHLDRNDVQIAKTASRRTLGYMPEPIGS